MYIIWYIYNIWYIVYSLSCTPATSSTSNLFTSWKNLTGPRLLHPMLPPSYPVKAPRGAFSQRWTQNLHEKTRYDLLANNMEGWQMEKKSNLWNVSGFKGSMKCQLQPRWRRKIKAIWKTNPVNPCMALVIRFRCFFPFHELPNFPCHH